MISPKRGSIAKEGSFMVYTDEENVNRVHIGTGNRVAIASDVIMSFALILS
jgi:hypothetical protein